MRRIFLFLFAGMLCVLTASAQDVIKMKDGKEIQAKISEITQDEIKYKSFDYQDGPTFTINKSDVNTITYANGMTEEIKATSKPAQSSGSEESGSFWKPSLYTNQNPATLIGFVDLGGFIMSGGKIGIGARWRRLEGDVFFKSAPSIWWWTLDEDKSADDFEPTRELKGSGFGSTFKVLLPTANSNNIIHVGLTSEISDLKWIRDLNNGATESWYASMISSGLGGGFTHYNDNGLFFRGSAYFGMSVLTGNFKYEHYYTNGQTVYWGNERSWTAFVGTIEATIGYQIPLKIK